MMGDVNSIVGQDVPGNDPWTQYLYAMQTDELGVHGKTRPSPSSYFTMLTPSPPLVHEKTGSDADSDLERDRDSRQLLEKRLLRKVDLRMSILVLMYVLNYIDRSNVAVARLRGFEKSLHLEGAEYPTVLSIFFVGYILMMIPSNMFLNSIERPSIYLPLCAIAWGAICVLTGLARNFAGILMCRFFLGFVEGSFFPGALLTLSAWYKHDELGLRSCVLFCGVLLSTAFGTLMATGILEGMEGTLGLSAWRWLFFIDGLLTVALAIPAIFILPDFPGHPSVHKWLSQDEFSLALQRKTEDVQGLHEDGSNHSQLSGFFLALRDWKVWWLALAMACFQVSISFHQFIPTLTQTLGYGRITTILLCSPPSFAAAFFAILFSRHSDHTRQRFPYIVISMLLGLSGYVISMCTMNKGARYFSIFLMDLTPGAYVTFLAWISNCFPYPASKRAVALGLISGFSQVGAIAASYVFPIRWGPQYRNSFGISIAAVLVTIAMCFIHRMHLCSLNEKAEKEALAEPGKKPFKYIL